MSASAARLEQRLQAGMQMLSDRSSASARGNPYGGAAGGKLNYGGGGGYGQRNGYADPPSVNPEKLPLANEY